MATKKVVDSAAVWRRLEKAFSRAESASPQNTSAMNRALTKIEKMAGRTSPSERLRSVRRWAGGSMDFLSPAGLAEGVAGAAAKRATEAKFKREAREQDKPTKGGMRRVKTKA